MLEIFCQGSSYSIGLEHGKKARSQVHGSLNFYKALFLDRSNLNWAQVHDTALGFKPFIERVWPDIVEEMRGVADGAGVDFTDILALNVRTEIAFGLAKSAPTDGCTALAWLTDNNSWLAQNWDWMNDQRSNLIMLQIEQQGKPTIKMITEAGIVGKIGMNSHGVGVLLNAVKAEGTNRDRLPCHLGLRLALESSSKDEAVRHLEKYGISSSCNMVVADATGSIDLEWSSIDLQKLYPDNTNRLYHTNHYIMDHPGVKDSKYLPDSFSRIQRIEYLCKAMSYPSVDSLFQAFQDEENYPRSICRDSVDSNWPSSSLFNIIMDLKGKTAQITVGIPTSPEEVFTLNFNNALPMDGAISQNMVKDRSSVPTTVVHVN